MGILQGFLTGYLLLFLGLSPVASLRVQFYDGDNLIVIQQGIKTKIHLACIDAPELKQVAGQRSRKALKTFIDGKPFQYRIINKDRYGRLLAEVIVNGENINRKMVAEGYAFYANPSGKGCEGYAAAQAQAQQENRGIWQFQLKGEASPRQFRLDRYD